MRFSVPLCGLLLLATAAPLPADPLTKQLEIDFGRDVASRNLKGLATRSDGRILPGPVFTDLDGPKLGEILWCLRPAGPNNFLVGTGPDGRVQEVTFNPKDNTYSVREVADVTEAQAMAVLPLHDGSFLVGTSPTAALYLARDGKLLARVPLPADSVFDFLAQSDGSVLAATGNPGKIYRLDLKKLAAAGIIEGKAGDEKLLAEKGVTLFGEIRDRNVRRLARLADGRVAAGSSPKGNVYTFPATGGAPLLLQENRDAEVVDLLPGDDGGFYAAIVFSPGEPPRIARGKTDEPKDDAKEPRPGFTGRSSVVRFPANGFPETLTTKPGSAFYRLARQAGWLLLAAGEQGDAFGYDPVARRALTFAGSSSAQLNDFAPLADGRHLLLRNNAPGLSLMSFSGGSVRQLETRRLDLGQPGELGQLRFARLAGLDAAGLKVEAQTNNGSDEIEGWSPWIELAAQGEGFFATGLRGRYVRLRLTVPKSAADFQIDKAVLYHLTQNRRPQLADFRIFPPNLGLIPASEPPAPSPVVSLGQMLSPGQREGKDDIADGKRKGAFLNSQIVPAPGTQVVYWTVNDPDGDILAYTFSILRADSGDTWIDLAVSIRENYVQFETGALPEGLYLTRLAVTEQAPRPVSQRLSYTYEADHLIIDRTPPVITSATVQRANGYVIVSVEGRDALSLLEGAEFNFNNGMHERVTHPTDGILDSRREKFVLELPEAKAAGATSVEILLYDEAGNSTSARLPLK